MYYKRFGLVSSLVAKQDILPGEEVTMILSNSGCLSEFTFGEFTPGDLPSPNSSVGINE